MKSTTKFRAATAIPIYGAPIVKVALRNRSVMPPRVNAARWSITADSGTKTSFISVLREAVARMPIVCQSSLNVRPGLSRGGIIKVRIVSPFGPSTQVASLKYRSSAILWVPKILRPFTTQPPFARCAVMRPRTTAQRANGGWVVNGRKIFGTQSIALDLYFSEATWVDGPKGETILTFIIPPRDSPGLTFKDDWHTMGMRATASRSTEMKDVFVPESAVMLQRAAFTRGGITDLFLRATFTIGAPYIGIAVAARNFVVDFMRERPRYPLKKPMSHLPAVFNKVGEMEMLIEGARAVMWRAAADVEHDEPGNWSRKAIAACMIARENSVRVV